MKAKLKVTAVALMTSTALAFVTGLLLSCTKPRPGALKPINKAALQRMVTRTARELMVPGAVVLLRTPQGDFTVSYGTTLLGATSPPSEDTPLPDRLEYQNDDGSGDHTAGPGRKAQSR